MKIIERAFPPSPRRTATATLTPDVIRKLGLDYTREFVARWDAAERRWFVRQAVEELPE